MARHFVIPDRQAPASGETNDAERLFDAGWSQAARWAERDDLLADMDSGTYKANRSILIAEIAPAIHVACQSGAVIREEGE